MFLTCSYFFPNLSLDVLIDLVLNQKNACTARLFGAHKIYHLLHFSLHEKKKDEQRRHQEIQGIVRF